MVFCINVIKAFGCQFIFRKKEALHENTRNIWTDALRAKLVHLTNSQFDGPFRVSDIMSCSLCHNHAAQIGKFTLMLRSMGKPEIGMRSYTKK